MTITLAMAGLPIHSFRSKPVLMPALPIMRSSCSLAAC